MLRKIYLTILNYTNRLFPFNNFIDGLFIHLNMLKSPDAFFIYGLRSLRLISGMKVKYVSRKEGTGVWCYAEKGKKTSRYPTMVFLHGFGGDKDQWPNVIARIPAKYHSVVIDMPGHGETTFLKGCDESNLMSYVRGLREFLQVSGLDQEPIFLIGCSFGGAVASVFAYEFPEIVTKLCLLCPAVKTPILTETCLEVIDGKYEHLIPKTGNELSNMCHLLTNDYHKWLPFSDKLMQSMVNVNFTTDRQELLKKLLENIVVEEFIFFEKNFYRTKAITADTLIIWGEDDKLLHVSGAYMLHESIQSSRLTVLKNCNHGIMVDQPVQCSTAILNFIN